MEQGFTYDEFGNSETVNDGSAFINEYSYTGAISDSTTGLTYMNARYYNPAVGSFTSQDTYLGSAYNPQSQHLYSYTGGNPINFIDPTGHILETILDVASAIWSVVDLCKDPSWANVGWLALDIVSIAVPFMPGAYAFKGASKVAKWLGKADDAKDVVKTVDKIADATEIVAKYGDDVAEVEKLYHYTSVDPDLILENGLIKSDSTGKLFMTPNGKLSPIQAQIDLALPPNRALPVHLFEVDVNTLKNMNIDIPSGQQVTRMFNMPGGGTEVVFKQSIPPEAITMIK